MQHQMLLNDLTFKQSGVTQVGEESALGEEVILMLAIECKVSEPGGFSSAGCGWRSSNDEMILPV